MINIQDIINGAVLMSFMAILAGCAYAWYRLIRWAVVKAWPDKRS
jgi:hypothetical protein